MNNPKPWQQELAQCIKDPNELLARLQLNDFIPQISNNTGFACRVPFSYLQRIKMGDINDPLLRQVLPLNEELNITPGYSTDPLAELTATPTNGLLHKYHGRVLLTLTGACAIHCRYCFRRHFPYAEHTFNSQRWQTLLKHLRKDNTIHEVILSGGDPLTLKDSILQNIIHDISRIAHIHTLRIHTRLPIVIPSRITPALCDNLQQSRLRTVMVVHCNHANEIDPSVAECIQQLLRAGVTLLNQSVVLRNVNDDIATLVDLSFALHRIGILPYYLHLPDKTQGTAHFAVSKAHAQACITGMRERLPGYLVPRLAVEIPGEPSKTLID